jgi:hypothetical protein
LQAGEKVAAAAPPLVTTLKAQFESPLIDFDQQQRRFAAEQSHDAVVGGALPWCGAGVADVNALKKNILSLSLVCRMSSASTLISTVVGQSKLCAGAAVRQRFSFYARRLRRRCPMYANRRSQLEQDTFSTGAKNVSLNIHSIY